MRLRNGLRLERQRLSEVEGLALTGEASFAFPTLLSKQALTLPAVPGYLPDPFYE